MQKQILDDYTKIFEGPVFLRQKNTTMEKYP